MAFKFTEIPKRAWHFLRRPFGPRNDILREGLEADNEKTTSYSLNSVVNDIKRNWVDIKKLNKKL